MKSLPLFASLLFALLFLGSCGQALQESKKAVTETSTAINDEFATVRKAEESLVVEISGLYSRIGELDLTTKGMDASEGGLYETFANGKYYYKKKAEGSALYASPWNPGTEELKRKVKFLEYVDPFLQKAGAATENQVTAFYGLNGKPAIALLNPFFDVVSLLPPGITMDLFEWFTRGLKSAGQPVWVAKPFTDFNHGWVMDVAAPVISNKEIMGVTVISVDLAKLSTKYLKSQKTALLLMGSDLTVVGLSPVAEKLLKISGLETVDYLKQVSENIFAPGKYRLDDASQAAEIQALGKALLEGKAEFEMALDGKTYDVVQERIPENSMVVVGFSLH